MLAPEVDAVLSASDDLSGLVVEITEQSPVEDYAELDRELVAGLDRDPHRAAAVAAIGAFASELDAWLVAEGVEREAELERLIQLKVPLVQGFLLGRPHPEMLALPSGVSDRLGARRDLRRGSELGALARPAPLVRTAPEAVAETTVLTDAGGRPERVFVAAGDRRVGRHPAMCVSGGDEIRSVALRAAARRSDDRFAPLCLCDDGGRLIGVIAVESLLEALARRK